MNPMTLAILADLAARVIDTTIRQAEARQAQAVNDHAARLGLTHGRIRAIRFAPAQEPQKEPQREPQREPHTGETP